MALRHRGIRMNQSAQGTHSPAADRHLAFLKLARVAKQTNLPFQLWLSEDFQPPGVGGKMAECPPSGNFSLSLLTAALVFIVKNRRRRLCKTGNFREISKGNGTGNRKHIMK